MVMNEEHGYPWPHLQDKFAERCTSNAQVSRRLSMSVLWTSLQPENV